MDISLYAPNMGYGLGFIMLLCNTLLYFTQYRFIISFTNSVSKRKYFGCYLLLSFGKLLIITSFFLEKPLLSETLAFCMVLLFTKYIIKQSYALSIMCGLLIDITSQLASAISSSLIHLIFKYSYSLILYTMITISSLLISISITAVLYYIIVKKIRLKSAQINHYFFISLIPILFLLLFYKLTEKTGFWGVMVTTDIQDNQVQISLSTSFGQEIQLFIISVISFLCIFSGLYSYYKIMESFHADQKRMILEQQVTAQKKYIEEAKSRIIQTMAFRHDFNKHLSVVNSLLHQNNKMEAMKYLNKLEDVTNRLSFPCSTGNPTIDALLIYKLSMADQMGIKIDCEIAIPQNNNTLDDMDLCIIFANAVDNAIAACQSVNETEKFIKLTSSLRSSFFILEFSNSFNPHSRSAGGSGIGISNMRESAEKYNGAVTIDKTQNTFTLNILLILSEHPENILEHMH